MGVGLKVLIKLSKERKKRFTIGSKWQSSFISALLMILKNKKKKKLKSAVRASQTFVHCMLR